MQNELKIMLIACCIFIKKKRERERVLYLLQYIGKLVD